MNDSIKIIEIQELYNELLKNLSLIDVSKVDNLYLAGYIGAMQLCLLRLKAVLEQE